MPLAIGASAGNLPVSANETASTSRAQPFNHSSPAALCQSILDAVDHPDLGKYLQTNSPRGANNKTDALRLFQNSAEFKKFSIEMAQCLKQLQSGRFGGSHCEDYDTLINRLELNNSRAGNAHYGSSLFDMYWFACLHFKQVLALLKFAQSSPKSVPLKALEHSKPVISNLEDELLVCGPGVVQKSETILTTLKHTLFPPGLAEQIDQLRLQTAQQYLGQAMNDLFAHDSFLEGNHVHMVKVWMQVLAPALKIKTDQFDDIHASKSEFFDPVPNEKKQKIETELRALTSDASLLRVLAQTTLEEVKHNLGLLSPAERKDFNGAIIKVMKPLTARFGELKESALFKDLELGEEIPQAMHNPALLVAELRDKIALESQPSINPGLAVEQVAFNTPGEPDKQLCFWGDSIWTEKQCTYTEETAQGKKSIKATERALVCFDDMLPSEAKSIVDTLGNNINTMIKIEHFLKELFINHPDFHSCFPHSAIDDLHPLAIALLCGYSNHEEASTFRLALNSIDLTYRLGVSHLFEAIRQSTFTLEQIDTALSNIAEREKGDLNWSVIQWDLLVSPKIRIDEQLFKLVMRKNRLSEVALHHGMANAVRKGATQRLKLLIEALDFSSEERSNLVDKFLKNSSISTLRPDILACLLSFNPPLDQAYKHSHNLVEHCMETQMPDESLKIVAEAWNRNNYGNFFDNFGRTPLILAAEAHLPDTVKTFLKNPAIEPAIKNNYGQNALLAAIQAAMDRFNLQGADVFAVCTALLDAGLSPNEADDNGNTPLLCVLKGEIDDELETSLVRLLVAKGANDITDHNAYNAISIACNNRKPETVKVLLGSENFTLHKDAMHHLFATDEDISEFDTPENLEALNNNKLEIFGLLLEKGISIDAINAEGKTPIDIAIENKQAEFAKIILATEPTMNTLNKAGYTRLHQAVIDRKHDLVRVLVAAGAKINAHSGIKHAGKTALHFAEKNGDTEMIALLKGLGANPSKRDFKTRTVETYANNRRRQ